MESVNMTNLGLHHWEYENPQQVEPYWFEKVDGNELRLFAKWSFPLSGITGCLYFLFVWLGPKWMKNRQPYNLDKPLVAWNFFMSLFSLTVVLRIVPEITRILEQPDGLYKSYCLTEGLHYSTTFWVFIYGLFKVVELGDTVFIVLRKKPLVFLHWYHHLSMLWVTPFVFVEGEPYMTRYFVVFNSSVHVIMYAYYGCRALQMKFPKGVAMTVTTIQISQFIAVLVGTYQQMVYYPRIGKPCLRTNKSLVATFALGLSYLALFSHMFYKNYLAKPKVKAA